MFVEGFPLRFLREVFERVVDDVFQARLRQECAFSIDACDFLVFNVSNRDGVDVVDPEGQDIFIGDGVNDGVGVESFAESLLGGFEVGLGAAGGVVGEDGRSGETEEVVFLERLRDGSVHVTELGAVAFVEDDDHVLAVDIVVFVACDEVRQLLNCGDDDGRIVVFQLLLQHGGRGVGVGSTLLEAVVLTHGLVVEVLAVDDKKDLIDMRKFASQLCGFE